MENCLTPKTRQEIVDQFRLVEPIYVTRPAMPALKEYEKAKKFGYDAARDIQEIKNRLAAK